MPDYKKAFRATGAELRNTQQPTRERDRASVDNIRRKTGTMSYAGETWPQDREQYGKPISKGEIASARSAVSRLNQDGDVTYGYTGREHTGRPYDNASFYTEARKTRDRMSNQANQGKPRAR